MNVTLLHNTPLYITAHAIRQCWASQDKSDTKTSNGCLDCGSTYVDEKCHNCGSTNIGMITVCGEKDQALIDRIGNKNKHSSTLEHLFYQFDIEGISRACLQELARHRIASLSVKSTRYTLKELKSEAHFTESTSMELQEYNENGRERAEKYLVMTSDERVNRMSILALDNLRDLLLEGISNDEAKYCLPEAYKTQLTWSINGRSLQNFLTLRTSKAALKEIRDLAFEIYEKLPEDHKYIFDDCIYSDIKD